MLKLIRALSEYNGPTYDGAVMARAVIKASVLENGDYSTRPVKMAPPRMGIIEAYKEGAASLTVTLLRPLVRAGEMPETVPQGEKQLSFVIDKPEINAYLDLNEWPGKAGAYAIQGEGKALVAKVEGNLETVIGMPVWIIEEYLNNHR